MLMGKTELKPEMGQLRKTFYSINDISWINEQRVLCEVHVISLMYDIQHIRLLDILTER